MIHSLFYNSQWVLHGDTMQGTVLLNQGTAVSLKKTVLPPDGMTKLKVTIRKRDVGNKKHHLRILMITNDPLRPKVEINIKR